MDYNIDPQLLAQQPGFDQQDLLIQMLRKQASEGIQDPQGQMVSGHYIAPNILQHIGAMLQPYQKRKEADALEQANTQKRAVLQQALQKAQQEWMSQMPQGTPAQPAQMSPAQQGNNPSAYIPPQQTVPAQPAQLPSTLERMKWMGQGGVIPGNGPLALAMGKMMESDVAREDTQQARKEQLQIQAQLQLAQKREEIAANLQKAREQGASQYAIKQLEMDGRQQIAALMAAMRAGDKAATREDKAIAREDKEAQRIKDDVEAFSRRADPVNPLLQSGQAIQDMLDSYKAKGQKRIPGLGYEEFMPSPAAKAEANNNRQLLNIFTNAMVREQAGLSQTLSEADRALVEMMRGNKGFNQAEFEAGWPQLVAKVNSKAKNIIAGHRPEAVEIFRNQGGYMQPIESKLKEMDLVAKLKRKQELEAKAAAGTTGAW